MLVDCGCTAQQMIGLQVANFKIVSVVLEQSAGTDVIRQHRTIDRAGKRCEAEEDHGHHLHEFQSLSSPPPAEVT